MNTAKETVFESVRVYLVFIVIIKTAGFFRGVLFARFLGPGEFGALIISLAALQLVHPVISLGIPAGLVRYIPDHESRGTLTSLLGPLFLAGGLAAVATTVPIVLFSGRLSQLLLHTDLYRTNIVLAGLSILPSVLYHYYYASFQGLRNFKQACLVQFAYSLLFTLAGSILIIADRRSSSAMAGNLFALLVVTAAASRAFWRERGRQSPNRPAGTSRHAFRQVLVFGIWLMLVDVAFELFKYVDRLLIGRLLDLRAVGIYTAGLNLAGVLIMLGLVAGDTLIPHLSRYWDAGDRKKCEAAISLAAKCLSIAILLIALPLAIFQEPIIALLFGELYAEGARLLPLLLLGQAYIALYWVLVIYAMLVEKTFLPLISISAGLVGNIALNFLLIPKFGLYGAAAATCGAGAVFLGLTHALCLKAGQRFGSGLIAALIVPAIVLLEPFLAGLIFIAYIVIALKTGLVFSPFEKSELRKMLAAIFHNRKREEAD